MFAQNSNGGRKVVLHVGCGAANPNKLHPLFRGPNWRELRLDIDPAAQPDIIASITSMPDVPSDSVDAVWSSHNLEHIYAHEVPIALSEFRRVLHPGGFVLITLPDLQRVASMVAAGRLEDVAYMSPAGPVSPIDMIYGFRPAIARGNTYMAHRTGFTAMTLGAHLRKCGFGNVTIRRDGFDLWAKADKSIAMVKAAG